MNPFAIRSFQLLVSAGLFLAGSLPLVAEDAPHLFILSGQSNMAGMPPETGFLPEARKLLGEDNVVYLKVARGGQPIRFWLPEWDALAKEAGLEQKNEQGPIYYEQIREQLTELKAKHPKFASVTFCWMQGERDAKTGLENAYEAALKQLIANLRRDLGSDEMYFVIGRLSDHAPGQSQAGWDKVREVQVKVAEEDTRGAWVDTDDLNNKPGKDGKPKDDLHYTKEGYKILGERYARQAAALIAGEKPAENGRPE